MITRAQEYRLHNATVFASHPKLTALEREMLTWAILDPGDKVLDMSPQNGLMLEYLARHMECEICGVFEDMENVKQTRIQLRNADILYATPEDIPWKENTFDTVFFHKYRQDDLDWNQVFSEIYRILKPGGQVLIGGANDLFFLRKIVSFWEIGETEPSVYRNKADWMNALSNAGYQEVTWQQVGLRRGIVSGWKPLNPEVQVEKNEEELIPTSPGDADNKKT